MFSFVLIIRKTKLLYKYIIYVFSPSPGGKPKTPNLFSDKEKKKTCLGIKHYVPFFVFYSLWFLNNIIDLNLFLFNNYLILLT